MSKVQHCGPLTHSNQLESFQNFSQSKKFEYIEIVYFVYLSLECQDALGMENSKISNGDVTASSELIIEHRAYQGRLHFTADNGKRGAWTARNLKNTEQWLQVDLGSQFTRITGVATQGREDRASWVKKYKLLYSNKTAQFIYYGKEVLSIEEVIDFERTRF